MTTAELLRATRERGIELHAVGDGVRYRAPRGALTDDLRRALTARKAEILAILTGTFSCGYCGRFSFHEPTVCFWCRHAPEAEA